VFENDVIVSVLGFDVDHQRPHRVLVVLVVVVDVAIGSVDVPGVVLGVLCGGSFAHS